MIESICAGVFVIGLVVLVVTLSMCRSAALGDEAVRRALARKLDPEE